MRTKVAVLGGTFDPIHHGHLRIALELKQQLGLTQVRLLPCHRPPHRTQLGGSSEARLAMAHLAVAECSDLMIDARELARDQLSFTVDTLLDLRSELGPEVSLIWALGMDTFASLDSWHRWQELLQYAHLLVVARPGYNMPEQGVVADLLRTHLAPISALDEATCGAIVLPELSLLAISATAIRAQIARGESPQYLVPDSVWRYIMTNKLYGK